MSAHRIGVVVYWVAFVAAMTVAVVGHLHDVATIGPVCNSGPYVPLPHCPGGGEPQWEVAADIAVLCLVGWGVGYPAGKAAAGK